MKKEKELRQLIHYLEKRESNRIKGTLRVSSAKGYPKYYHHFQDSPEEEPRNHYLKKEEWAIARKLAQQEYEEQLLKTARSLLKTVSKKATEYDDHSLQKIYDNLHEARKALVTPVIISDDEYVLKWLHRDYAAGTFAEDEQTLLTENGERVRSKSEKIIADKYHRMSIPYLYEAPLELKSGNRTIQLRPDFTLLNKRTRKQYFHEHFGMIDHPDYANSFLKKLELYAENGIFPGDQLLMTMESSSHILNEQYLNILIEKYLL